MRHKDHQVFQHTIGTSNRSSENAQVSMGTVIRWSILMVLVLSILRCRGDFHGSSSQLEGTLGDSSRNPYALRSAPAYSLRSASGSHFQPFGEVTVAVDFEVNGAGSNIDTIAFWEAPNPEDSLMLVTSKDSNLVEVWQYPFADSDDQLPPLTHSCLENGTNGVEIDQEEDRLHVSVIYSQHICVFSLPGLEHLDTFYSGPTLGHEPNLAWLKLANGSRRLYVSDNDEQLVYIYDALNGQMIDQFTPTKGVEDFVGDSYYQLLYLPDEHEHSGIYPYHPDGSPYVQDGRSKFGEGVFEYDAEGILIYSCPADGTSDNGQGLIVVSDQVLGQGSGNEYEVFDRQTWDYLGKIKLQDERGRFVYNTDGIASVQQPSPDYPRGVFAAINSDTTTAGVGWGKILDATDLGCEETAVARCYLPLILAQR